jgi:hypothetical protein
LHIPSTSLNGDQTPALVVAAASMADTVTPEDFIEGRSTSTKLAIRHADVILTAVRV